MNDREKLERIERVRGARTGEFVGGRFGEAFEHLSGLTTEGAMFLLDHMLTSAASRITLSRELNLHAAASMDVEQMDRVWLLLEGMEMGAVCEAIRRGDG